MKGNNRNSTSNSVASTSVINDLNYHSLRTGEYDDDDDQSNFATSHSQKKLMEQDRNLDELSSAVSRLGNLSYNISREIEDQNRMLDELEGDIDGAEDKASSLLQKAKEVLRKGAEESGNHCCIISCLVGLLLLLTFLVIYT